MNLGEKIYELRMKKNLSQGDLADRLQVSRQSVSKWENNTAVPDLDKLIKLCDVFEVSLDEITERAVPKEKPISKLEEIKEIKNNLTKKQRITIALFGVLFICAVIFPVFLLPLFVCGIIYLTVKKNPWYWCIWVMSLPVLFIVGGRMTEVSVSNIIIEIAFLLIMAFATYKAFKDTEIVIPRKKSIAILVSSIVCNLLYVLFHLWNVGCFGAPDSGTIVIRNGEIVKTGMITSGLTTGLLSIFLTAGVVLSWIGILLSVKNLRKNK